MKRALSTLPTLVSKGVAQHLVMAAHLIDVDPALALEHAEVARVRAGRVGVVREAVGITAYRAGDFAAALRELRAARRLLGSDDQLAMIADSERALGRPEKALDVVASAPAGLDPALQLELLIVGAGARLDLGQPEQARQTLEIAELDVAPTSGRPEARQARARLMSAYSDALVALGRDAEANQWLAKAAAADVDGSTGAAERLGLLDDDVDFLDLDESADDEATQSSSTEPESPEPGSPAPEGPAPESTSAAPESPAAAAETTGASERPTPLAGAGE